MFDIFNKLSIYLSIYLSVEIHAMSIACADACLNHGIGMSREDIKCMNTVQGSFTQFEEGHCQVHLLFRN